MFRLQREIFDAASFFFAKEQEQKMTAGGQDGLLMNGDLQEGWSSFAKISHRVKVSLGTIRSLTARFVPIRPSDNYHQCQLLFSTSCSILVIINVREPLLTSPPPPVEGLTVNEQRLLRDKGMRTDTWTEALPRVLPVLISLRRARLSRRMYLDARHIVQSGVKGLLAQLTSFALDGVFFSSLPEFAAFFEAGSVKSWRRSRSGVTTYAQGGCASSLRETASSCSRI
ncbi:hypothetical protein IW261DRAFT_814312 [Armillaria novae-zelandiae]|uniref:Uncharacterized protein n=1 Tax=Armillaria novae-zelandiae TaxID=153914 RepID=A0AA39NUY6_9AGAR|nr:hypothetical protein IW261DRAFT_814312 [Armillaria novae-zelandiae]